LNDAAKLDAILKGLNDAAEERKSDRARMDASEKERKADREKLDSYCAKSDAAEKERADAEAADNKARADATAEEIADAAESQRLADAACAESGDTEKLREEIAALSRLVPAQLTGEVRQRLVTFQSKAERVAQAFGDSAGAPTFANGESEIDYRVRLLSKYRSHSKVYRDADLSKVAIADADVFTTIEDAIYADALHEASNPSMSNRGVLIPQKIRDSAGREITKYIGEDGACWDRFAPPIRYVVKFRTGRG
jgi:hypothetical protein